MNQSYDTVCDDGGLAFVRGCRGDFDFSLLAEQALLSVIPSGLFLLLATARFFALRRRPQRVGAGTALQRSKLVVIACYLALQVALLVSWAQPGAYRTTASVPAATLCLVAALTLAPLSWLEHAYSPRPSALINVYLLVSLFFDAVQLRTFWLNKEEGRSDISLAAVATASLVIKTGLLALEVVEKRHFLGSEWTSKSPELTAGVYSRALLVWLHGTLTKGASILLLPADLSPLRESLGTAQLSREFHFAWRGSKRTTVPGAAETESGEGASSLVWALVKVLKWPLVAPVLPRLVQTAFTICQPLLLRELLHYLDGRETFVKSTGYGFIITYGLVYLGLAVSTCIYWRLNYRCLVQLRGCIVSALYQKTLHIEEAKYDMDAPITLVSTDMERLINGCKDFHEIWSNSLQVAITIWLLYRELGVACVAPAAVAIVSSLGSMAISSPAGRAQVSWMEATQERVGTTARAVNGMRSVKLLGLSESIYGLLHKLREAELHAARHFRHIEVLSAVVSFLPLLLSPVFTFLVFVLQARNTGRELDTVTVFVSLSLLQLMTQPLVWLFQAVPLLAAALGCISRVESYLNAQERLPEKRSQGRLENDLCDTHDHGTKSETLPNALTIRNGDFAWVESKSVLGSVDMTIPAHQLTMIVGPVASGKSTLAKGIVGQLPHIQGQLLYQHGPSEIAFCDQEPFIMDATLAENIVGFCTLDVDWLDTIITAVDLHKDLATLPQGKSTPVGSRGSRLSGGQRQRVSIARALYARKQFVVFDDVLSSLDPGTKDRIFGNVFGETGLLRRAGCTVILCSNDVAFLPQAAHVIVLGRDGKVADSGTFEHLVEASPYVQSLTLPDTTIKNIGKPEQADTPPDSTQEDAPQDDVVQDDITRRVGDASVYKHLARHVGLWRSLVFLAFTCGWSVFSTIGPVWLNFWSSASAPQDNAYYLGVYAALQACALLFLTLFAGFALTSLAIKAGTSIHHDLLHALIWAPVSFFTSTDVGNITNRFSGDIVLIDGELPMALLETVSAGLVAVVQMVLMAVAAPFLAISYPFIVAALYYIQHFYLMTSRQLRFIDLEARAPLQTQMLETIHGLATIRTFGWAANSIGRNHELLDASQRPVYLLYMIQRWLQLVLELLIAVLAVLLVAITVNIDPTSNGLLGVALIQLMSLSQELKMVVIHYTSLETSLTAVARAKSFKETTPSEDLPEEGSALVTPSQGVWPQTGNIRLDNISVDYGSLSQSEKSQLALRNVSLDMVSGQKIAICGRSGSGKSTLLAALTGLVRLSSGSISIDGVDTATLRPSALRSALNTIPQEPFLFHKTVAKNLDPSGAHSDEILVSALEQVDLWEAINNLGGLHAEVSLDRLSLGQKQLLALTRATLKTGHIVLLDEATSSVDQHTAELMHRLIRTKFQERTVIAILHQLQAVLDFDLVVIMADGEIAELGRPAELLKGKSMFRELWDAGNLGNV